jgi:hypothetical protein
LFGRKPKTIPYDREKQKPIIHCSICTGEQAGGLKDLETGKFTEVMLIKTPADLEKFLSMVGLEQVEKEY